MHPYNEQDQEVEIEMGLRLWTHPMDRLEGGRPLLVVMVGWTREDRGRQATINLMITTTKMATVWKRKWH